MYISKDVKKNEIVTKDNVKSVRPGYGLHPKHYNEILGKKFVKDLGKGERMNLNLLKRIIMTKIENEMYSWAKDIFPLNRSITGQCKGYFTLF